MNTKSMKALEFDKILEKLSEYAISDHTKQKLLDLSPYLNERDIKTKINETGEAVKILNQIGTPPLASMKDLEKYLELSEKGSMLVPEQLTDIGLFLNACARMKRFLKKAESLDIGIAGYGGSFQELSTLGSEIDRSIRNNSVEDTATKELKDIRRKIDQANQTIKTKLENLLRSKKEWFNESYISSRNGHYVLPVRKEYKHQVSGSVLDISSTGSTYFILPTSVMKIEEERSLLEIEESNEVRKILYTLTALVAENSASIRLNMECMEALDFIFAKAKLSIDMKATTPTINSNRYIKIKNGKHPLINPLECVPLNFSIGDGISGIVITGPNTGGKTVALKTVGLLQLMAQSGLHVPCERADLCMNNLVLCDIGDGQSITENLSTFSSHITNIINILAHSSSESLVLLDELGSGTDPAEGMGIAIAILEELINIGCLFVATTHYPEVKEYANKTKGLLNAKMAFDRESLKPLYRLEIGEAGESCALYIAKRLGLPNRMLERAYEEAYCKESNSQKNLMNSNLELILKDDSKLTQVGSNSDYPIPTVVHRIEKEKPKKQSGTRCNRFQIGDSVMVYPQKKIGIVYETANEKGEVGVQIQKKKVLVNHKRIQLKASASEMYPEDYDFSIVFDSVANRKARRKMEKGYQPDLEITYEKDSNHYN
ncbi:DNA mismatch repair protein MutS [Mobilitalea sibirica]|uniref:DNA mismatch repair protein MutS n=1 Tax=Mobilitalea sibirica TaxID=1462919 RepID=A0A8J7HDJ7_9FIRM|nr:DNA mismatch repair protein MutS [Mobilitalea sibirica]MBH1940849.1 DNA mismatch repair protein MutS [Mobilitalea sibirica]